VIEEAPERLDALELVAAAIPGCFRDTASAHEAEAPSSSRRVHFAPPALTVAL
jgi:hypothetical protein